MNMRKFFNVAISLMILATTVFGASMPAVAMPASAVDETKVPHYFGPYPNYANSAFTLPDVNVNIAGDGTGAKAAASVGANGIITAINVTDPGIGYTNATVEITGGGTGATASATVTTSGIVTSIIVDAPGAGYTRPTISMDGGGGTGTLVEVGNPLIDRANASDTASQVFVVLPKPLPTGQLQGVQTWNQATAGGSDAPSAGRVFNAYVLRPTGTPDQYTVIFDSGPLTVPALADPTISEVANFPVGPVAIQAGDVMAFYGNGIPLDIGPAADITSYPAVTAPAVNATVTLGSAEFPMLGQDRTYSIMASVIDTSAVATLVDASAIAYGGVDQVLLADGGSGYTMPTVDFDLPDDPNGVQAKAHAEMDASGRITAVIVDSPGSGYTSAPGVAILDGTRFNPVAHTDGTFTEATATTTLALQTVIVDTYGAGYTSAPVVTVSDPTGSGASATAKINAGGVTSITLTNPGSGYITTGGIKKFQDGLPLLCDPSVGCQSNNLGQHIPIGVPDTTTFSTTNGFTGDADYYVIGLVQHRERMNSSLPESGTLLREYVQLETPANASWSKHVALVNDMPDGTQVPVMINGQQAYAVDDPHYLGPVIVAEKDRAVRLTFYNLLPTGAAGDLFIPVDSTFMGAGMGPHHMMEPMDMKSVMDEVRNPMCGEADRMRTHCFAETRATIHLHGGITPWISDGSPHQWITPAGETTMWPQGVSVMEVPDMVGPSRPVGTPDCSAANDGCMTFYYTNQQSARLMFYHDHSWGITRLNVYVGEAGGYILRDATEKKLIDSGLLPSGAAEIPLVIQDKTFVPSQAQMAEQDPTWDYSRYGAEGDLWYEHVYMPAQNPGDPSGMSAYGRWMYGPWFWPPATPQYGPIDNPYYDPNCNLDDPATWQYEVDPFCEPPQIPGTPNNSAGMEQFNDTPVVNGTAYPTTTVDPKAYRFRILNAGNDRFFNLQWYIADPTTGTDSEVALKAYEVEAAQTDPTVFPTPDTSISPPGPSWIQIGTEGGFLPAPVVIPNQHITWITDPTRFDVGNVDQHSLLLGPAERADVIVDFSRFAGKTLILYNDAPAAFPARVPSYDYYTGAPDMYPNGAPTILPGYGPNTRTIMQVKVANTTPAAAYNLTGLRAAFRHHADGSGVFESGQHPIIVGQAAYNTAYGTSFVSGGFCNASSNPSTRCDGFGRISDQGGKTFKFDTLKGPQLGVTIQPKAIHDEMNFTNTEPFGRMSGMLGVEVVPATPGTQNSVLYPFVNPATEMFDATNLPETDTITPIAVSDDGTQIWKITHNGVDTHPIHFHLYDVQLLNRVAWDNIITIPDANELGWKDTVRVNPLQDTYFAIRPIIPKIPFEIPNSIRPLNPMMPLGDTTMFTNIDAQGNPTAAITNQLVNFGWEYMLHCHILSHEEMDMMRPVSVALPPNKPVGFTHTRSGNVVTLTWTDDSISETEYVVQKQIGTAGWVDLTRIASPLDQPNTKGTVHTYADTTFMPSASDTYYRIVAKNVIGYGGAYKSITAQSVSDTITVSVPLPPPAAPTNVVAAIVVGPQVQITWNDNATDETGFVLERSVNGAAFAQIAAPAALTGTGSITYIDSAVTPGATITYRVAAVRDTLPSEYATSNSVTIPTTTPPAAPTNLTFTLQAGPQVRLVWRDNATNETGYIIERSVNDGPFALLVTRPPRTGTTAGSMVYTDATVIAGNTYQYRVAAVRDFAMSAYTNTITVAIPLSPAPAAPTNLTATLQSGPQINLSWRDNATTETAFVVERSVNGGAFALLTTRPARTDIGTVTFTDSTVAASTVYQYRVAASNNGTLSAYVTSNIVTVPALPAAPTNLNGTAIRALTTDTIILNWTDNSNNETGFIIQRARNSTFTTAPTTRTMAANTTSYRWTGYSRGIRYYFRIAAVNSTGQSAWSNVFTVVTP